VCQRLLPQDDRPAELRIPIAPFIDERLAHGDGDGYRYEDMPWDDASYRLGLAGIDQTSRALCGGVAFTALDAQAQDVVLAEARGHRYLSPGQKMNGDTQAVEAL
jgi:gluconate 2-dehydrogenase gamma chain